jgi:membrane-bound lytic murein transglycosylase B
MSWFLRRALLPGLLALAVGAGADAAPKPPAAKSRKPAVRSDHAPDAVTYGSRPDVVAFGDETALSLGLDPARVRAALAEARYLPSVARLIMPPPAGTAKNWRAYRARFVDAERVRAGVAFWDAQRRWLDAANARHGVPPEIVVGIVGVETYYGRLMGNFRVLDALATLAFDFPPGRKDRSAFFRRELQHLLLLADRDGVPASSIKGSYAGAIGLGQFMPGSILRFAVDGDDDQRIDLRDDPADVVASIAHFLAVHGWQPGLPTHFAVKPPVDTADRATLLAPDIVPSFRAGQFAERGAVLDDAGRAFDGPLALVELQNGDAAPSHVAGTQNFYALTRYNWSSYYALAVIELGRAVRDAREARETREVRAAPEAPTVPEARDARPRAAPVMPPPADPAASSPR